MNDLLGDGIFAVDGEKWRHQRKLASFEFSTKVLRDFSTAVFLSNAVKLASKVSTAAGGEIVIDLQVCIVSYFFTEFLYSDSNEFQQWCCFPVGYSFEICTRFDIQSWVWSRAQFTLRN